VNFGPTLRVGHRRELAVQARQRRQADVQVEIGGAALDEHLEHVVEVHRASRYASRLPPCASFSHAVHRTRAGAPA
jgi:hypothetical protein